MLLDMKKMLHVLHVSGKKYSDHLNILHLKG